MYQMIRHFLYNKNTSSRGKWFKGTVSVVSSDPPCKDGNDWFKTLPLQKALSDLKFCFFKLFICLRVLCESNLRISCVLEAMEKLTEIKTVRVRKRQYLPLIRSRFQGYHRNSGIVIAPLSNEGHLKLRVQSL